MDPRQIFAELMETAIDKSILEKRVLESFDRFAVVRYTQKLFQSLTKALFDVCPHFMKVEQFENVCRIITAKLKEGEPYIGRLVGKTGVDISGAFVFFLLGLSN